MPKKGTKKGKGRKGYRWLMSALVVLCVILIAGAAFAGGNRYIPGSKDLDGHLGEDGKSFQNVHFGNRIIFEGETSDAYEWHVYVGSAPGGMDNSIDLTNLGAGSLGTNAVGNTQLDDDAANSANIIDNTVSTGDILNSTVGTLDMANDAINSAKILDNSVGTGDILNGTLTANDLNYTVNLVNVAASAASTTETVTSGAVILGYYPVANITTEIVNSISISSTTLTLVLNTTATVENVYKVITIAP
ncbi:MAG: hypothetical protein KAR06_01200 [Deltaproteobacteria bacterium]|nr:hypothetical protein [Deltaproteobacteria bacterium]